GADPPAPRDFPVRQKLAAIAAAGTQVAGFERNDEQGRRRIWIGKRSPGLFGPKIGIEAEISGSVDRKPVGKLRAITGLEVAELLGFDCAARNDALERQWAAGKRRWRVVVIIDAHRAIQARR